jgi:hypothetical protein
MKMNYYRSALALILAFMGVLSLAPSGHAAITVKDPDVTFTQARKNFLLQYSLRDKGAPNIIYHVTPRTPAETVNMMEQEVIIADQFWSFVRPINHPVELYMTDDSHIDGLISVYQPTLTAQGAMGGWLESIKSTIDTHDPNLFGGGSPAYDKNNHANFMLHVGVPSPDGLAAWTQTPSHEYTHTIQRYLLGSDFAPMYVWQYEGQADYIGTNLATRNSNIAFQSAWAQLLNSIPAPEAAGIWTKSKIEKYFLSVADTRKVTKIGDSSQYDYILGAIAQEYLVGHFKYPVVEKYYADLAGAIDGCGDGDLPTHPLCDGLRHAIFEKNFGMTLENFYKNVATTGAAEFLWAAKSGAILSHDIRTYQPSPWLSIHLTVKPDPNVQVPIYAESAVAAMGMNNNGSNSGLIGNQAMPQKMDPYPADVPAPDRSCPQVEGAKAKLWNASLTCINGFWKLDPGEVLTPPSKSP